MGYRPVPVKWNERLSVAEMSNLIPPQDAPDCYIADFLYSQVPSHTDLGVDTAAFDSNKPACLRPHWRDIQNSLGIDMKRTGVSQPLFAFELKSIMRMYADKAIGSTKGK